MVELRVYALTVVNSIPVWFYWGLLSVVLCLFLLAVWWKGWKEGGRCCGDILLVAWMALVVASTVIFRESSAEQRIQLEPFRSYWDFGEHSYFMECFAANVLNVVLFVPVGFLAGCWLRGKTLKKMLLLGGGLSVFIELLQFVFKKGFCETDDVIHNVLGCLIGYGLSKVIFNIEEYENKSYRIV